MRTTTRTLAVATSALVLAACSSTASSTATGASTAPNVAPTSANSAPSAPISDTPTATDSSGVVPTLDPCQLVTQAEASALSGVTYGPGKEDVDNKTKICTYQITGHSLSVQVAQASDAASADAMFTQQQARAQANLKALEQQVPAGMKMNVTTGSISGLGDRAANISGNVSLMGRTMGISGIYILKGPVFFAFEDLTTSGTVATASAMQAQAQTSVGRIS